jgi:predicted metal-dependent peptidase
MACRSTTIPEFVDTLNSATLAGVLAHEVMHPALQHHVRRSGRDPKRWNEACDYAINPLLLDAGLSLPDGVLVDHRFRGMSAEQIYNLRVVRSTAAVWRPEQCE